MLTPAQFRAAFPAFADADVWADDAISAAFALSVPSFDVARWGARLDLGQGNWVAWYLSCFPPTGAAGTAATSGDVTSKTVGRKTVQRGSDILKMEKQNPYLKNAYGELYWFWAQRIGVGAIVVTGSFTGAPGCVPRFFS